MRSFSNIIYALVPLNFNHPRVLLLDLLLNIAASNVSVAPIQASRDEGYTPFCVTQNNETRRPS